MVSDSGFRVQVQGRGEVGVVPHPTQGGAGEAGAWRGGGAGVKCRKNYILINIHKTQIESPNKRPCGLEV